MIKCSGLNQERNLQRLRDKTALNLMKPVYLYGKEVERIQEYKYLVTIFDTTLKLQQNTEVVIKKVNQRMYVLRKLNSFCVQKNILRTFYTTFIESFSFLCWYSSLSLRNKNRLQPLVRTCSIMIAVPLRSPAEFYTQHMLRKTRVSREMTLMPRRVSLKYCPLEEDLEALNAHLIDINVLFFQRLFVFAIQSLKCISFFL